MADQLNPRISLVTTLVTIGMFGLLSITPLGGQPVHAVTPQERLALLEKISESHSFMCGDDVFAILEGGDRWIEAAKTPSDRASREKLLAAVIHHSELIAAVMMVTDPDIRRVISTPLGDRYQSIITHAAACDIKLTLEGITNAPSADAYLTGIQTKAREEIRRLVTEADAPQKAFDRLSAMFISSVIGRWAVPELKALRD